MVFRLICLLALLFSCAEKKEYNAETESRPKVVEAKGYVVPQDSMAAPRVILFDESKLKKISAGNPKIVPTNLNVHIAGQGRVVKVDETKLRKIKPGNDTFTFPKVVPALGKIVVAKQSKPCSALPFRMKDAATCNIQYLDIDQGLNSSYIFSILEDKNGNLWFGTQGGGVSRYDGESFTNYTQKEGLSHYNVFSILQDKKGNLWFGTYGGGVSKYDGKNFTHFTKKEGLSHDFIRSILEDKNGNLWFGTNGGGVSKYDGKSFTHYSINEGLSNNFVRTILEDKSGNLWFGTNGGGISKYDGIVFTHYTQMEGLSNDSIYSILEDKCGNLWFGTNGGLSKFDGKSFTNYSKKDGLPENIIRSIREDAIGNLWIGTYGGGACKFDGNSFTHFTEKEGLSKNYIISILEDKIGNLWFGTDGGGVSKYKGDSFMHYTKAEGLPDDVVLSILEDKRGNLWFGTKGGGACYYDRKGFTHYTKKEGLPHNFVLSILEDKIGNLWFGTYGGGACKFDGNSFTHYTQKEGLSNNIVWSILEDRRGNIWFGTDDGVSKYDRNSFTNYTIKEGLPDNKVMSILEDKSGNLWFGTNGGGVCKFDGKHFTHFKKKDGIPNEFVFSILEDKTGELWFGTSGRGICKYDGKYFSNFTEKEGLSNNYVFSIQDDRSGNLWVSTEKGLNYFEMRKDNLKSGTGIKTDVDKSPFRVFHVEDGLKGEDYYQNSVLLDSKNQIWWGSGKALNMLDLNKFKLNDRLPFIKLQQIYLQEKFVDYNNLASYSSDSAKELQHIHFRETAKFYNYPINPEFPHDINHLTFQFSAIDWYAPHKLRYQYKLEGLDSEWSSLTADNKADYRKIPFGRYTFKVKAIGSARKWSEPFEYTFTIRPPWWRTWWAYAMYSLAGIGGIAGLIRFREKSLRRRQQELQEKVTEATGEIREQKQVIEEKHRQVLDSIEYARRIQSSILPPPKIVQQYLEDSFILYLPKDIVAGDFYWMTEVDGEILFAACDCTGHGVPGAMVSVVCSNALNKTVKELGITEPGRMLDKVSELVKTEFQNSGNEEDLVRDGMDISLCRLDLKNRHLQWAGANNPLWLVRNTDGGTELIEVKADRQSVGSSTQPFKNHSIRLHSGDCLYLFSDGYCDQFGGPEEKKFSKKRLRELLLSMAHEGMTVQREQLVKRHLEWKGNRPQVDDICVIGVRV